MDLLDGHEMKPKLKHLVELRCLSPLLLCHTYVTMFCWMADVVCREGV